VRMIESLRKENRKLENRLKLYDMLPLPVSETIVSQNIRFPCTVCKYNINALF
jgi:hypothetical protein